jgi:hypothetical protein
VVWVFTPCGHVSGNTDWECLKTERWGEYLDVGRGSSRRLEIIHNDELHICIFASNEGESHCWQTKQAQNLYRNSSTLFKYSTRSIFICCSVRISRISCWLSLLWLYPSVVSCSSFTVRSVQHRTHAVGLLCAEPWHRLQKRNEHCRDGSPQVCDRDGPSARLTTLYWTCGCSLHAVLLKAMRLGGGVFCYIIAAQTLNICVPVSGSRPYRRTPSPNYVRII